MDQVETFLCVMGKKWFLNAIMVNKEIVKYDKVEVKLPWTFHKDFFCQKNAGQSYFLIREHIFTSDPIKNYAYNDLQHP